jgi:hypothetical protein
VRGADKHCGRERQPDQGNHDGERDPIVTITGDNQIVGALGAWGTGSLRSSVEVVDVVRGHSGFRAKDARAPLRRRRVLGLVGMGFSLRDARCC